MSKKKEVGQTEEIKECTECLYYQLQSGFKLNDNRPSIPKSVTDNLRYTLRDYQIEALQNFIFYNELSKDTKDKDKKHLLFHMATGSGKTQVIASCILYLYEKGYRNFVFFTNANGIIEKTIGNFIKGYGYGYLFEEKIVINRKNVSVSQIEGSFDKANKNHINILFTSIQQLHLDLLTSKEDKDTLESIRKHKVAMIADEAHHLNAGNKMNKTEAKAEASWTETVKSLLDANNENILLEFTATAGFKSNANLMTHYKDKVIYDFDFKKFHDAGYSKRISLIHRDSGMDDWDDTFRITQALMLSEYRAMLAEHQDINQAIKPVVLFKNMKGTQSADDNLETFARYIGSISIKMINEVFEETNVRAVKMLEKEIKGNEQRFIERIKRGFSKENCIVIHSKKENKAELLKTLNRLEDPDNTIRAIFAVDMLNEGWDVKNLYDIVKLDEHKSDGKSTTADVQLIGRGARYYPFNHAPTHHEPAMRYKRKFDTDLDNPLGELEKMYFHSKNNSKYIEELLYQTEQLKGKGKTYTLKLKESFKKSKLYQEGYIYTNTWEEFIPSELDMAFYLGEEWRQWHIDIDNNSDEYRLLQKQKDDLIQKDEICFKKEDKFYMRYLLNIMGFSFEYLKSKLPMLKSVDEFITGEDYLGGIAIIPSATREIDFITKQKLILQILASLEYQFENRSIYYGVNDFFPQPISSIKDDKTLSQSKDSIEENGDWFVYEKVYADSSYESEFVAYIKSIMPKLQASYEDVKLIRNVEQYTFYHKDTGGGFQPDFFLMLQKEDCTYQILCEAKGEDRADGDRWKEDLMGWINELTHDNIIELNNEYGEETTTPCQIGCYKLYGTKFYQPNTQGIFDKSLNDVISYR